MLYMYINPEPINAFVIAQIRAKKNDKSIKIIKFTPSSSVASPKILKIIAIGIKIMQPKKPEINPPPALRQTDWSISGFSFGFERIYCTSAKIPVKMKTAVIARTLTKGIAHNNPSIMPKITQ